MEKIQYPAEFWVKDISFQLSVNKTKITETEFTKGGSVKIKDNIK